MAYYSHSLITLKEPTKKYKLQDLYTYISLKTHLRTLKPNHRLKDS